MTRDEIRKIIDKENGPGFSLNINLNGYTFTKNGSFIVFELKNIEDVKICQIKYIYFKNEKDLITILVNCCNFWMGNEVQFIFFKEKKKHGNSAIKMLQELNFRTDIIYDHKWKYDFNCIDCGNDGCKCEMFYLYK